MWKYEMDMLVELKISHYHVVKYHHFWQMHLSNAFFFIWQLVCQIFIKINNTKFDIRLKIKNKILIFLITIKLGYHQLASKNFNYILQFRNIMIKDMFQNYSFFVSFVCSTYNLTVRFVYFNFVNFLYVHYSYVQMYKT